MSSAREIAIEVLPHFQKCVLSNTVTSYGYYARAIGRIPGKDARAIGKAMHTIGAICVFTCIPIVPLYFVKRDDEDWRGVFQSDMHERDHVLPHYNILYAASKVYAYTAGDFARIAGSLTNVIPKHFPRGFQTPHLLWRIAIHQELEDGDTWFQKALKTYTAIVEKAKTHREAPRS